MNLAQKFKDDPEALAAFKAAAGTKQYYLYSERNLTRNTIERTLESLNPINRMKSVRRPTYDNITTSFMVMSGIRLLESTIGLRQSWGWKLGKRRTSAKALGISYLSRLKRQFQVPGGVVYFPKDDITDEDATNLATRGYFARPCPKRARHGFIESRKIRHVSDIWSVLEDVQASDEPNAEVVFMPFISADYSAIVTPDGYTIAKGHDGATSGRDAVFIPEPMSRSEFMSAFNLEKFQKHIPNAPYLELLMKHTSYGCPTIAQIRDGPFVGTNRDYVPETLKIENVVLAEGDLVAWETKAQNFGPGTVVYHPGGTLNTHYGAHCVMNKVPVLCTREPVIGETLECTVDEDTVESIDYVKIRDHLVHAIDNYPGEASTTIQKVRAQQAIIQMHNLSSNTLLTDSDITRAVQGMYDAVVYATAAGVGECRYGPTAYDTNADGDIEITCGLRKMFPTHDFTRESPRERVYEWFFKRDHKTLDLNKLLKILAQKFESESWGSSLGGPKWARCMYQANNLLHAISRFITEPTEENWVKCFNEWNKLVNMSHNTGNLYNKWGVRYDKSETKILYNKTLIAMYNAAIGAPRRR